MVAKEPVSKDEEVNQTCGPSSPREVKVANFDVLIGQLRNLMGEDVSVFVNSESGSEDLVLCNEATSRDNVATIYESRQSSSKSHKNFVKSQNIDGNADLFENQKTESESEHKSLKRVSDEPEENIISNSNLGPSPSKATVDEQDVNLYQKQPADAKTRPKVSTFGKKEKLPLVMNISKIPGQSSYICSQISGTKAAKAQRHQKVQSKRKEDRRTLKVKQSLKCSQTKNSNQKAIRREGKPAREKKTFDKSKGLRQFAFKSSRSHQKPSESATKTLSNQLRKLKETSVDKRKNESCYSLRKRRRSHSLNERISHHRGILASNTNSEKQRARRMSLGCTRKEKKIQNAKKSSSKKDLNPQKRIKAARTQKLANGNAISSSSGTSPISHPGNDTLSNTCTKEDYFKRLYLKPNKNSSSPLKSLTESSYSSANKLGQFFDNGENPNKITIKPKKITVKLELSVTQQIKHALALSEKIPTNTTGSSVKFSPDTKMDDVEKTSTKLEGIGHSEKELVDTVIATDSTLGIKETFCDQAILGTLQTSWTHGPHSDTQHHSKDLVKSSNKEDQATLTLCNDVSEPKSSHSSNNELLMTSNSPNTTCSENSSTLPTLQTGNLEDCSGENNESSKCSYDETHRQGKRHLNRDILNSLAEFMSFPDDSVSDDTETDRVVESVIKEDTTKFNLNCDDSSEEKEGSRTFRENIKSQLVSKIHFKKSESTKVLNPKKEERRNTEVVCSILSSPDFKAGMILAGRKSQELDVTNLRRKLAVAFDAANTSTENNGNTISPDQVPKTWEVK